MFVTFSPRLSILTLMPSWLVRAVASRASSTVLPATKRRETFRPTAERSAKRRRRRLSERAMKRARNKRRAFYIRSRSCQVRNACGSRSLGHCNGTDAPGTAVEERFRTGAKGLTRRADVVDEKHGGSGRLRPGFEDSADIRGAGRPGETRLSLPFRDPAEN